MPHKIVNGIQTDLTQEEMAEIEREAILDGVRIARNAVISQIIDIEARITPRRIREAFISEEGLEWLNERNSEIITLRTQLGGL